MAEKSIGSDESRSEYDSVINNEKLSIILNNKKGVNNDCNVYKR